MLTQHQKLTIAIVAVIGVTTIIFGILSLHKAINVPFYRQPSAVVFKTEEQLQKEQIEALKTKDTDHDGLSDYDELYIYRTSPFLEDSDSDGISDKAEIERGTDPNCPEGKTCRVPRTTQVAGETGGQTGSAANPSTPATGTTESPSGAQAIQAFTEAFGDLDTLTPEIVRVKLAAMSTADLRAFFVKLGIPEAAVAKADDATLRQLVLDTLQELSQSLNTTGNSPSAQP